MRANQVVAAGFAVALIAALSSVQFWSPGGTVGATVTATRSEAASTAIIRVRHASDGRGLPGAQATLVDPSSTKEGVRSARTDEKGEAKFEGLRNGAEYLVRVEFFGREVSRGMQVQGASVVVEFRLEPVPEDFFPFAEEPTLRDIYDAATALILASGQALRFNQKSVFGTRTCGSPCPSAPACSNRRVLILNVDSGELSTLLRDFRSHGVLAQWAAARTAEFVIHEELHLEGLTHGQRSELVPFAQAALRVYRATLVSIPDLSSESRQKIQERIASLQNFVLQEQSTPGPEKRGAHLF